MGNGLAASLTNLSSAASALLMLRFVMSLTQSATVAPATPAPAGLLRFWPLIVVGAALLPYLSFPFVGDLAAALTFSKVWDSLWPILVGGALAVLLARADDRLPRIPVGDTIGAYETLFSRCLAPSTAIADAEDGLFRQWPAAGLALLAIALVLAVVTAYAGVSPG